LYVEDWNSALWGVSILHSSSSSNSLIYRFIDTVKLLPLGWRKKKRKKRTPRAETHCFGEGYLIVSQPSWVVRRYIIYHTIHTYIHHRTPVERGLRREEEEEEEDGGTSHTHSLSYAYAAAHAHPEIYTGGGSGGEEVKPKFCMGSLPATNGTDRGGN
jgi:hypothetical protein